MDALSRKSTDLYEKIVDALEPIYLTEDEHYGLEEAVRYYLENCDEVDDDGDLDGITDTGGNLLDAVQRLENIVVTPREDD